MIAYLEGNVLATHADYLIVKTTAGVGYQLFVPQALQAEATESETHQYYVHTHSREGDVSLYGFRSFDEKRLFEALIKTSGVGPKLGIAILSHFSLEQLLEIFQTQDTQALNAVSGVGKKTAAKLAMDMADQLKKDPIIGGALSDVFSDDQPRKPQLGDLISALQNIGFSEKEILPVARQVSAEESSMEAQIKKALVLLSSR